MKPALARPPSAAAHAQADDGSFELDVAYVEYVRGFDDLPVLSDAVHAPPRPRPPPDFRRGERPDVRKEPRPDSYALRETIAAETAACYAEYCGEAPATPKRVKTSKRGATRRKPRAPRTGTRGKSTRSAP